MLTEKELYELLKAENESLLLEQLKGMDNQQRRALAPLVKKVFTALATYKELKPGTWGSLITDKERDMLLLMSFVCLSQKEFNSVTYSTWILDYKYLDKVKSWYIPDWFSNYVNNLAKEEYLSHSLKYDHILQMAEDGFIKPEPELLAKTLTGYIYLHVFENNRQFTRLAFENLEKNPVTLQEHIWHLFEVETNVHYSGRYIRLENGSETQEKGWINVFLLYCQKGKLDRKRLLRESLLASNRNFNKNLSGWFTDLFVALEPSTEELIELQSELIAVLSSPISKPVNESLAQLKKIVKEPTFNLENLTFSLPAVLSSKTKATVTAALSLLELAAREHPGFRHSVAGLCCHALLYADEAIQTKAAKLIIKYPGEDEQQLMEQLLPYRENLLLSARTLLAQWLQTEHIATGITEQQQENSPAYKEAETLRPVTAINNLDDLLFLAAQAFDNNDPLHFIQLPTALIMLQEELKGEALSRLQPALQRALKLTRNGLQARQGLYDHMLAVFFIDACIILTRRYPEEGKALEAVFEQFNQKTETEVRKWLNIEEDNSYLKQWEDHYKEPFYLPYRNWLLDIQIQLRNRNTIPPLSTPTHYPGWIAPEVLASRLMRYQQEGKQPGSWDFQLAISRCMPLQEDTDASIIAENLSGEWKQLLLYVTGSIELPEGPFTSPDLWFLASLCKQPATRHAVFEKTGYYEKPLEAYTGQWNWRFDIVEFERDEHRYENGELKKYRVQDQSKELLLSLSKEAATKEKAGFLKGLLGMLKAQEKTSQTTRILHDYISINAFYFTHEHNDIQRAVLMNPHGPEVFLPHIIQKCLAQTSFSGENEKRMVLAALQILYELWDEAGEMAHLFLCCCLLSSDKTIASTAAELWLKQCITKKVNSSLLGQIAGKMQKIEFAPLKRLTDLILQSLFRVSPQHNQELQAFIEHLLVELPVTPVRHLKKLLEIYQEVLAVNGVKDLSQPVRTQLENWKEVAALKKVVESLLK